jgi:hypothetical protein
LVLDLDILITDGVTEVIGATQVTGVQDGVIRDGVTQDGDTLDITDHTITTTLIIMAEEDLPLTMEEEIIALTETTQQIEDTQTETIQTETIQQTDQIVILTTEEVHLQTEEHTLPVRISLIEEALVKVKTIVMITLTDLATQQQTEATITATATLQEVILLAHHVLTTAAVAVEA